MSDRLVIAWIVSSVSAFVTLSAFLTAYDLFGHTLLTNINYLAAMFYLSGMLFLVLTIAMVVTSSPE